MAAFPCFSRACPWFQASPLLKRLQLFLLLLPSSVPELGGLPTSLLGICHVRCIDQTCNTWHEYTKYPWHVMQLHHELYSEVCIPKKGGAPCVSTARLESSTFDQFEVHSLGSPVLGQPTRTMGLQAVRANPEITT